MAQMMTEREWLADQAYDYDKGVRICLECRGKGTSGYMKSCTGCNGHKVTGVNFPTNAEMIADALEIQELDGSE